MNLKVLKNTISQIFSNNRGILAMDESISTCNKRFEIHGISQSKEMRRKYRQLIANTPNLDRFIGGAILSDETILQKTDSDEFISDILREKGIIPGIKVDKSTIAMPNFPLEKITEGLDGLRQRLDEYKTFGVRFAKWRAVITIGENIPTETCIEANIESLVLYAAFCQEVDIVPIVEPEVLMIGNHSIQKCYEVTQHVLKTLFFCLYKNQVQLEGIILKPNMIIAGKTCPQQNTVEEVAGATFQCLYNSVPASVPAIAFLSGGQYPEEASAHLNAIHTNFQKQLPWIISFSFARAIQQQALSIWNGKDSNIKEAQKMLLHKAKMNVAAGKGKYHSKDEKLY